MAIALRSEIEIEAAPEDVGMSSERLRNVSRLVQTYIDDRKLPGAISLVARRGKVVHFETYGNMDDERQKPMRTDTTFRFYSMTKPIASVALMMLYEEGRFQLDEQRTYISGSGGLVSTAPTTCGFARCSPTAACSAMSAFWDPGHSS